MSVAQVFWPLQVTLGGQPIRAAGYDKVWALLAYLTLSPGRAYSRDSLAALPAGAAGNQPQRSPDDEKVTTIPFHINIARIWNK